MVKMVLGSSDAQGQTMSSVGKARVTAYNSAVTALSNFNGAGDLQGSAYDSGKQYGVSVIAPLIKGAIMYSEYLSEAVPKLPSKYRSEVGGEDLDSAVLESEIQSLESSISSLRGTFRAMESSDHSDKSLLQNISSRMDSLTSQKNEKMDKLRKLNLFAGSSNEVFSGESAKSMDTVVKNLASGLNMIQGDFASFGGTFPKHSGKTLNWAKSIEGEWDKKAKIDEDYQKVLEKANQGKELSDDDVKKINAYKSRYSNRELPENIQQKIDAYNEKKKKEIERKKKYEDNKKIIDESFNVGMGFITSLKDNVIVKNALSLFSNEYLQTGADGVGKAGKWMAQSAVSKLSRFVTATQEGVNGFVMMNSNSRAYRTAFMEASKLSKFGSILSTVGKVVEHPLFTPVAIGIGTLNDVLNNGKKPGQALVYNSTETLVGTATAGLTTAGITALSSTPVGWAGLAGVAAGYGAVKLFQWGYDSNFLGMKDGIDWIGSKVDDGIDWGVNKAKESGKWLLDRASDVGQAFSDGFSFINPFD
ncbi:hypothetical protein QM475_02215 [Streptococcus parasanguinis]|uniref:hypothetical protein n=1 Tax=Streptococcus parasanguinis TaxID=1318 RepID=UPI0039C2BB8B